MTDLAQVALDFCRLCLGWERPVDRKYSELNRSATGLGSLAWSPYVFDYYAKNDQFRYTDLNAVMREVRKWADRHSVIPKIEVHPERMIVSIYTRSGDFLGSEYYPDLCHGLLAACVEAARKLKATA